MNAEELIQAIETATREITVKVESTDFYRRQGDTEDRTIKYVDPDGLIDALKALS